MTSYKMSLRINEMDRIINFEVDGPFVLVRGYNAQIVTQVQAVLRLLKGKLDGGNDALVNAESLYPGKVLGCMYNNNWYRCQVRACTDFPRNGHISVELMDFGTEVSLPLSHLRELTPFNSDSLALPGQHQKIYLQGLISTTSWNMEALHRVKELMKNRNCEFQVRKLFSVKNRVFASVYLNGTNLAEILMKERCGTVVDSSQQRLKAESYWAAENNQHSKDVISPSPDMSPPNISVDYSVPLYQAYSDPSTGCPMQGSIAMNIVANPVMVPAPAAYVPRQQTTAVPHNGKEDIYSPALLSPNEIYSVTISCIEKGPVAFYVQCKTRAAILKEIDRGLREAKLNPLPVVRAGQTCVLKIAESFFRGIITSCNIDCSAVFLVDIGSTKTVNYEDLSELPSQLHAHSQQAFKFCLSGLLTNPTLKDNPEVNQKFAQIAGSSSSLMLAVVPPDGPPLSQYCNLKVDGKNILDLLLEEANKPLAYETRTLSSKTSYDVMVSFVDIESTSMPWEFYVQLLSECDSIDATVSSLECYCSSANIPEARHLKPNNAVLAQYQLDGNWYRGIIKKIESAKASVFFVDYGNTEEVPLSKLRATNRTIVSNKPAQAIRCIMDGLGSNKKAAALFLKMSEDKIFNMTVIYRIDSCNALNVRLMEKGCTTDLNDIINLDLLHNTLQPKVVPMQVESVPESAKERQQIKVKTASEINDAARVFAADEKVKKQASQPLFIPPHDRKKRRDWDDPGSNFLADKTNPIQHDGRTSTWQPSTSQLSPGSNYQQKNSNSFNESDRVGLKRFSDHNRDDGEVKRFHRPDQSPKRWQSAFECGDSKDGRNGASGSGWNHNSKPQEGRYNTNRQFGARNDDRGSNGAQRNNSRDRQSPRGIRNSSDNVDGCNKSRKTFGGFGDHDSRRNDFFAGASQEKGRQNQNYTKKFSGSTNEQNRPFNCVTPKVSSLESSENWENPTLETPSTCLKVDPFPIQIGQTLLSVLVFTTSPSDFFIQPTENAIKIDEMTAAATSDISNDLNHPELNEGDFCWAKFVDDGAWYRAVVKEKCNQRYKVAFLDYGNVSEVDKMDVRTLKPEQAKLPAQSIHCALRGTKDSNWSSEELEIFETLLLDKEIQVTIVAKMKDKFSVTMTLGDDCVNTKFGASQESLLPLGSLPLEIIPVSTRVNDVTFSWFTNPSNFFLHRTGSCENLRDKIDVPEESFPRLPLFKPTVGSLVHFNLQQKLYRGKIVAIKDGKCKVQLIDHGCIKIAQLSELNALPEEFASYPVQAIFCGLHDVQPADGKPWPKAGSNKEFDCIFSECREFNITVKNILPDGKLEVELHRMDGNDVVDLLRKGGFVADITPQPSEDAEKLIPKAKLKVFVTFFEHYSKFYVQKVADQKKIEGLLSTLQKVESEGLEQVEINQLILAKNAEDELWYRCSVTSLEPEMCGLLVDYGNVVSVKEARKLPEELGKIPPFATCCCIPLCLLPHFQTEAEKLIETELFREDEAPLEMVIEALANEFLVVDFKLAGSTLIDKLFTEGMCIRTLFEGYVSNILSLEAIDCQNAENTAKLEAIGEALTKAEEFPVAENVQVGDQRAAKFADDGLWYRADVVDIEDGRIEVNFRDYGNSAVVTDLRVLPEDLQNVEQLCQLARMINLPENEMVKKKIRELLSDETMLFEFLTLNPREYPLGVVIFKDGIDIRKVASPGLNIMAEEFVPMSFTPPKDLCDIAVFMASKNLDAPMGMDTETVEVEMTDVMVAVEPPKENDGDIKTDKELPLEVEKNQSEALQENSAEEKQKLDAEQGMVTDGVTEMDTGEESVKEVQQLGPFEMNIKEHSQEQDMNDKKDVTSTDGVAELQIVVESDKEVQQFGPPEISIEEHSQEQDMNDKKDVTSTDGVAELQIVVESDKEVQQFGPPEISIEERSQEQDLICEKDVASHEAASKEIETSDVQSEAVKSSDEEEKNVAGEQEEKPSATEEVLEPACKIESQNVKPLSEEKTESDDILKDSKEVTSDVEKNDGELMMPSAVETHEQQEEEQTKEHLSCEPKVQPELGSNCSDKEREVGGEDVPAEIFAGEETTFKNDENQSFKEEESTLKIDLEEPSFEVTEEGGDETLVEKEGNKTQCEEEDAFQSCVSEFHVDELDESELSHEAEKLTGLAKSIEVDTPVSAEQGIDLAADVFEKCKEENRNEEDPTPVEFVFREPLTVLPPRPQIDEETSSVHGSDMSIDDLGDCPTVILHNFEDHLEAQGGMEDKEDPADDNDEAISKKPSFDDCSDIGNIVEKSDAATIESEDKEVDKE
ncbi:maternal protein tudor-like isoform X2 [Neocloeon triangulifer]|uniref:maternal protein tudor-like isoform X2 n=1 Tax=Neocloeon triangulifer TaxID=2078957 RepID=UPI00286F3B7C|nr:maternal protein tudor-like isoform X2 [Neocloeon triangulifer]